MKSTKSALPEILGLPESEKRIYLFVLDNWPSSALEIAENFNESVSSREQKKRASTKYSYYLKKLVEKKLLVSKKAGNSMIVWPLVVEKYRAIHDILKHHESEHLALLQNKSVEDSKELA
jgi:predicted transcriptional regulator